ncbi:MAG: T9SS type A sorting domain-containing protein, partial [Sphingobacteriales bacterium]
TLALTPDFFSTMAWIDYDHSGTFDSLEMLYLNLPDPNTGITNTTFYVPASALTGLTGLRVRAGDAWLYESSGSCIYDEYGYETEDYVVEIVAGTACSGTPSGAIIVPTFDSVCIGQPVSLNLSGYPYQQNITFQWQQSPAGQSLWADIPGATNPGYTVFSLPDTMDYRTLVSCNGTAADTTDSVTVLLHSMYYCYQNVTNAGGGGSFIDNVSFGSISNNTAASNPVAYPFHTFYQQSTNAVTGTTVPLSVTIGPPGMFTAAKVSVWIDFNRDGNFTTDEWQQVGTSITSGTTATINVTIPVTAVTGLTGMRIRSSSTSQQNAAADAFFSFNSGETEDYMVNITQNPLLIKLLDIAAINTGSSNRISWSIHNAAAGDRFELERSRDGKGFSKLAEMPAIESTKNYSFIDASPFSGISYYRLRMISAAGEVNYSKLVSANMRTQAIRRIDVFPNPARDILTIQSSIMPDPQAFIELVDLTGRTLRQISASKSTTSIDLNAVAPGIYMLRFTDGDYEAVVKVVKE